MTTQNQTQLQRIWEDLLNGTLTPEQARAILPSVRDMGGRVMTAESIETFLATAAEQRRRGLNSGASWAQLLETKPVNLPEQLTTQTGELPLSRQTANAALEQRTDPQTAYLSRLGIGGKQFYNPAESYQASLFDPYKKQYDIRNRLMGPSGPFVDPAEEPGSFSDFLNASGGGGLQGLISGAQGLLGSIFGGTTEQKTGAYNPNEGEFGLGYEPGQGPVTETGFVPSEMDKGKIEELQNLLRYGLRGQTNPDAAAWAALRLPRARQAYYGQKVSGQLSGGQGGRVLGPQSFLDWLKPNWGLRF